MTTETQTKPLQLERIPQAAKRMAISVSQCYREITSGRVGPLIKLGERASALPSTSVDKWINDRIAEADPLPANAGIQRASPASGEAPLE